MSISQGDTFMATIRPGYFRLPPLELGATLIFVPTYIKGLSAMELALWASTHGFGDMAYIPAKAIRKPVLEIGVQA